MPMDAKKFEKKVTKLHKMLEKEKYAHAASGVADMSGKDISHQQRVALMSLQAKLYRLGKKDDMALKVMQDQRVLVGKMAPYLTEAISMTRDGQFDDSIPRLQGALKRPELEDENPALALMFPTARNIVAAHLMMSLDEQRYMKETNRPSGFTGGEDRKHMLTFSTTPEAYYYLDLKKCPRCSSPVKGGRTAGDTTGQLWTIACTNPNCHHQWKRLITVRAPGG
jgi:hypothetical protein